MECSAGWLQLLLRFCPAIRHWPDRDSSDWLRALSATTNKSTTNAAFGNDASRFFLGICIVLPNQSHFWLNSPAFRRLQFGRRKIDALKWESRGCRQSKHSDQSSNTRTPYGPVV